MSLTKRRVYRAGQALRTPRFLYSHVGIATDLWRDGEQLIVSCSGNSGKVVVEPLSVFSDGYGVSTIPAPSTLAPELVLQRAYMMIGKPYSLLSFNCEHFLAEAFGSARKSPQLAAGILLLLLGFAALQ
jgi:hypothetical protein